MCSYSQVEWEGYSHLCPYMDGLHCLIQSCYQQLPGLAQQSNKGKEPRQWWLMCAHVFRKGVSVILTLMSCTLKPSHYVNGFTLCYEKRMNKIKWQRKYLKYILDPTLNLVVGEWLCHIWQRILVTTDPWLHNFLCFLFPISFF